MTAIHRIACGAQVASNDAAGKAVDRVAHDGCSDDACNDAEEQSEVDSRPGDIAEHVGIADATNYEVISGLEEGEMVALPGDVDLKDGMPVKITNTDASYIRGRSESD